MQQFEFSFVQIGSKKRPIVPISLLHGSKIIDSEALVDSGADRCVFRKDIAEDLGIDLSSAEVKTTVGVGGREKVFIHPIKLVFCGKSIDCTAAFSDLLTSYNLIGRDPFFNEFDLLFKGKESKLVVISR